MASLAKEGEGVEGGGTTAAEEPEEDAAAAAVATQSEVDRCQAALNVYQAKLAEAADERKEKASVGVGEDDEDRQNREKEEEERIVKLTAALEAAEAALAAALAGEEEQSDEEEEEEEEEDPRVGKLRSYASSHTVQETVDLLVDKIGNDESFKPCVIGEALNFSPPSVMAFLLIEAMFDLETGPPLSQQLKDGGHEYLKELCGELASRQTAVLCAVERALVEWEAVEKDLHRCLNQLYGFEVVTTDETFEHWFEERGVSREFSLDANQVDLTRRAAEPFMEWLRTAEESGDDEEIEISY